MNQSELVLSIVLENDDVFHHLSAREIATFMASCKNAWSSKVLNNMRNKHRAVYLYDKAWHMMDEAYFVLKHYRTAKDLDLSHKLFKDHKEFVQTFHNETTDVKDCLSRLLIAEYKELLYDLVYGELANDPSHFDNRFLLITFKSDMLENLPFCNISTHIHNPTHYSYMDTDNNYYKFYSHIEKTGKSVLEDSKCIEYIDMIEGTYHSDSDDE